MIHSFFFFSGKHIEQRFHNSFKNKIIFKNTKIMVFMFLKNNFNNSFQKYEINKHLDA